MKTKHPSIPTIPHSFLIPRCYLKTLPTTASSKKRRTSRKDSHAEHATSCVSRRPRDLCSANLCAKPNLKQHFGATPSAMQNNPAGKCFLGEGVMVVGWSWGAGRLRGGGVGRGVVVAIVSEDFAKTRKKGQARLQQGTAQAATKGSLCPDALLQRFVAKTQGGRARFFLYVVSARLEKKKPIKKTPFIVLPLLPRIPCVRDLGGLRRRCLTNPTPTPPTHKVPHTTTPAPPSPSTCRRRSSTLSHTPRTKTRHPAQTRRANITWESCSIPCFPLPSQHPVPFLVSPCPHNPHGV